jgi:membrane protein DedA with SNARE-associated domain
MLITVGDRFFDKHGSKAVFFGRWVALVRIAAAWLAGINHMQFREFFFWNALGGITWGLAFGLAGYFGGHAAAHLITEFGIVAAIVLVVLVVVGVIVIRVRERRAHARIEAELADQPAPTASSQPPDPARKS